jgi:hypothetical protein
LAASAVAVTKIFEPFERRRWKRRAVTEGDGASLEGGIGLDGTYDL